MRGIYILLIICLKVGNISLQALCGKGTFQCKDVLECIDDGLVCNSKADCKDGTDEVFCNDKHQDEIWNLRYQKRPDADREIPSEPCEMSISPPCICREQSKVFCNNAHLTEVPGNLPEYVTELDLSGNELQNIGEESFSGCQFLQVLYIRHNKLRSIKNNTFWNCTGLEHLNLVNNNIRVLEAPLMSKKNSLKELYLDYNELQTIPDLALSNLHRLQSLYITHNRINFLHSRAFHHLHNLRILFLTGNRISKIEAVTLEPLPRLTHLHLGDNRIDWIEELSFKNLQNLVTLTLSNNRLGSITENMLSGLTNVTFLDFRDNQLLGIHTNCFKHLLLLKSLDLTLNPLRTMNIKTLRELKKLDYVYFDQFYMCVYAIHVKHCKPFGNGISSQKDLLDSVFLRMMVWVVSVLSIFGNLIVIFGRILLREDNQVHSFYIKNLSLADILMGIYLFIIGVRDFMYRGTYLYYDQTWRYSNECDFCGILCTISSTVSVITLAMITLDRYVCIMFPWHGKRKNFKVAYIIMTTVWTCSIFLSILPIFGLPYFGNTFYRDNAVCIPLHLHEPRVQGWEYSSFIFLGITFAAFSFMCFAYIMMYINIHQSTKQLRSHFDGRQKLLAKRFFLIVFTDFLCWAPIMTFKVLAIAGTRIEGHLYSWIVIFILPINSALNPLLYTLTTKLFREKILPQLCCGLLALSRKRDPVIVRKLSMSSSSSGHKKRQGSRASSLERDLFEVGVHTLRCAAINHNASKYLNCSNIMQMDSYYTRRLHKNYICYKTRGAFSAIENPSSPRKDIRYFPVSTSADFPRRKEM